MVAVSVGGHWCMLWVVEDVNVIWWLVTCFAGFVV